MPQTEAEKRRLRAVRQRMRHLNKPPRVVASKQRSQALQPKGPPPRTVHVSELTALKMSTGNEHRYRVVIDADAVIEWVGFGWIMIRVATEEDRKKWPRIVRGHQP